MVKLLTAENKNTRLLENTGIPGKGSRLEDLDADGCNTFPPKNCRRSGFVDHAASFSLRANLLQ